MSLWRTVVGADDGDGGRCFFLHLSRIAHCVRIVWLQLFAICQHVTHFSGGMTFTISIIVIVIVNNHQYNRTLCVIQSQRSDNSLTTYHDGVGLRRRRLRIYCMGFELPDGGTVAVLLAAIMNPVADVSDGGMSQFITH